MRNLAYVLALLGVLVLGITATVAFANPEEACEKWPNNKQCDTTSTGEEPPTTTGEEPPPTTTDEEPPPTTTEEEPPPPNNGGTTGGTEPPPEGDLPFTGLDAKLLALIGAGLLASGVWLVRRYPAEN